MNKSSFYFLLLTISCSFASEESRPVIELEGCFTINIVNNNLRMSLLEKVAVPLYHHLYASVTGEQALRNRSFENNLVCGGEYRFGQNHLQIPLGIFTGINNFHIGQYTSSISISGINTGMIIWLNQQASLRINYLAKLYFDEQTIFGSDVYIGFSYTILKKCTQSL